MRKAPFLEELSITADIIVSNPVLLGFTPPSTLRKLVLDLRHIDRLEDPTVIVRFLDRFSGTSLKELQISFNNHDDVTPDILIASICRLNQLQRLAISFFLRRKPWKMDHFVNMLVEGCPCLLSLELNLNLSPSACAIKDPQKLQHLRHLGIKMDDTPEYNEAWDALGTLSQLHSVCLFSDTMLKRSSINNLKNQRPGVKVVAPWRRFRL